MKNFKYLDVGGMSEAQHGLDTIETIKSEALGNYTVLFDGFWNNESLKSVAEYCSNNGYKFVLDERINRYTAELMEDYKLLDFNETLKIIENNRQAFDGSLIMCEYGGVTLYWPANYLKECNVKISATEDFAKADSEMIEELKNIISYAEKHKIPKPYISIEASGGVARQLYKAGIDRVDLEVTYSPDNEFFYSAVKGATQAYHKKNFGVDMAMVWYGGNQHDSLWHHRWNNSLKHAFIRGANPIYAEHGLMNYVALNKNYDSKHKDVKRFRESVGELAQLTRRHPRPEGFSQAKIAVIHGNLDSFTSLGQTHVWGQRNNDKMKNGSAEASWELFNTFYKRSNWEYRYQNGEHDYSGNPPMGQVDVIPAESPLEMFRKYSCLIFLGWNSMTEDMYSKLTDYVYKGGHLLATAAHLNCSTSRNEKYCPINNGDLKELFGLSINPAVENQLSLGIKFKQNPSRGAYKFPLWSLNCDPKYCDGTFPMASLNIDSAETLAHGSDNFDDSAWNDNEIVMTANKCGQGMAFLVNSLEYPGYKGLRNFYCDLLKSFSSAWRNDLLIECSDRVKYAVYTEADHLVVYLLNTEKNLSQNIIFSYKNNKNINLVLGAGELKAVYCTKEITAVPENIEDRIIRLGIENGKIIYQTLNERSNPILFYRESIEISSYYLL